MPIHRTYHLGDFYDVWRPVVALDGGEPLEGKPVTFTMKPDVKDPPPRTRYDREDPL